MIVYKWARRHFSLRGGTTTRPYLDGRRRVSGRLSEAVAVPHSKLWQLCPGRKSEDSPHAVRCGHPPTPRSPSRVGRVASWAKRRTRACETPGEPRAGDLGVGGLQIMGEVHDSIALKPHGVMGGVWRRPPGPGLGSWLCGFSLLGYCRGRMDGGWQDLPGFHQILWLGFVSEIDISRGCFLPTCGRHQQFTRWCISHPQARQRHSGRGKCGGVSVVP